MSAMFANVAVLRVLSLENNVGGGGDEQTGLRRTLLDAIVAACLVDERAASLDAYLPISNQGLDGIGTVFGSTV